MSNPIPGFDKNHVLPPHKGDPRKRSDLSPYECTSLQLCEKFATSAQRVEILKNFLKFRQRLTSEGVIHGFQWLDGSFLEDIELQENRPPNDLDLVTVYWGYAIPLQIRLMTSFPEFWDSDLSKDKYLLDHYPFDAAHSPKATVDTSRYWSQLFSHNRNGIWKGMLSIELNTPTDDAAALTYLQNLSI